jgi:hypothetical protein
MEEQMKNKKIYRKKTKPDRKKTLQLWKYSGVFLIATGILHTVVALILGKDAFTDIFRDGFINAVGEDLSREFAVWFLVLGVFVIFFGQVLHYYIKKEQKPIPLFLGYNLLILSIIGCLLEPASGFWLFIPQALIIIFAKKKTV